MFGNNKGKIPKETLTRLKTTVAEAAPHLAELTAALAIVRREVYALLPLVSQCYQLGGNANQYDAFAEGGADAFLDLEMLRPQLFALREFCELQNLLANRAKHEYGKLPRTTLKASTNGNGNGRHAAKG